MAYADLILPLPLHGTFTYLIPESMENEVLPGKRVLVQFGSKKIYSAIVKCTHNKEPGEYNYKAILSVLDDEPVISGIQLEFWEWISDYYMCSEGEVLKAAMPSGLRLESETRLVSTSIEPDVELTARESLVLKLICNNPMTTIKEVSASDGGKPVYEVVKSLIEKKAVMAQESLREGGKPKTETFITLHPSVTDEQSLIDLAAVLIKKAPRQHDVLMAYLQVSEYADFNKPAPEVAVKSLPAFIKSSTGALKALFEKKILRKLKRDVSRIATSGETQTGISILNQYQSEALDSIKDLFNSHEVVLLHGITSPGKTELFIHLIRQELDKGKQVLYLLPEIALTAQIIIRLKQIFGEQAGVYHSKFSDSERVEIWNRVLSDDDNSYRLILGVRSSLFLPFTNLGLIIVDEEHENTFKQFDPAPRYHARDAAIMLASMHKAKTLLGTATPSVESYFNARSGKYGLVNLTRRHMDIELPLIIIANTREARKRKQMKSLFTPQLLEGIKLALDSKEQVILFQNRRGYAPYLECNDCGWIPVCKHCDVSMTYHKVMNQMICHYCGSSEKTASLCPDCGSVDIKTRGIGTERIEDEISIFFPGVRVGRLDLDSVRKKRGHEKIIGDFEAGNLDILVGTQMIAKGLDFSGVTLVGIINADNLLFFPDFRAHERSFQLISQVSGRAGRKTKQGAVIIQTGYPEHPVIKNIISNDFAKNYREQLQERKQFMYPPFVRLFRLVLKDKSKDIAEKAASSLANNLRARFGNRVLGPEYPVIGRVQNRYIMNILIKIEKGVPLSKVRKLVQQEINLLQSDHRFKSCNIIPDVDPL